MTDVIHLNDTISRNVDYSFGTATGIQNADSVRFTIFSLSSYVFANKEAGEQYHTFKPELLQHLTPGKGLIMMTAFRFIPITASGTDWAVLHQVSAYKEVYIN